MMIPMRAFRPLLLPFAAALFAAASASCAAPRAAAETDEPTMRPRHEECLVASNGTDAAPARTGAKTFGARQKRDGHENERLLREALTEDAAFRAAFCARIGRNPADFLGADGGGLNETRVATVLGAKSPGKTDLTLRWRTPEAPRTNVSVKMDENAQVHLTTPERFAAAWAATFGTNVPPRVAKALGLFFGTDPDAIRILDETPIEVDGESVRALERSHNGALCFNVLAHHDATMAEELLDWLRDNRRALADLCFSRGYAADPDEWAQWLWYRDLVRPERRLDRLIRIADIADAVEALTDEELRELVRPGPKNGGTTILLPFGHLQYLHGCMEFYQSRAKIERLLARQIM